MHFAKDYLENLHYFWINGKANQTLKCGKTKTETFKTDQISNTLKQLNLPLERL